MSLCRPKRLTRYVQSEAIQPCIKGWFSTFGPWDSAGGLQDICGYKARSPIR